MKLRSLSASLLLCMVAAGTQAQQVSDTLFTPVITKPAFKKGTGPVVMIDEAHHNFHTASGRFRPFALLLERDGFQVSRSIQPFNKTELNKISILVVSNALHERNDTIWTLPTPSAFTDNEINALQTWVHHGGSLFLIADHMPFPGCNEKLANAFGFTFTNGFVLKKSGSGPDLFCYANGRLQKNKLTEGIDSVYSFTGQAFHIPPSAKPVLVLDDQFENLLPREAWQFNSDTKRESAAGMKQGAYLEYGEGKVFVSGEAAMFTAQIAGGQTKMGFNEPRAKNNVSFLLNIMHWLAE